MSDFILASFLALIQGLTEFLPVSSSAHLILPAQFWHFGDQGLLFDTAVHGGTLLAVMAYYRQEILLMLKSVTLGARTKALAAERQQVLWLLLASLPVLAVGYLAYDLIATQFRSVQLIASTTIIFGLLLGLAALGDKPHTRPTPALILCCGLAQILALAPGVSRSGISITAALLLGFEVRAAARVSFLLSIPVIGAAFAYGMLSIILAGEWNDLAIALWGATLAGAIAYFTIGFFLRAVTRIGMLPFVIYRILLGLLLFALVI